MVSAMTTLISVLLLISITNQCRTRPNYNKAAYLVVTFQFTEFHFTQFHSDEFQLAKFQLGLGLGFESYLSSRSFRVKCDNHLSSLYSSSCDVPHVSVAAVSSEA